MWVDKTGKQSELDIILLISIHEMVLIIVEISPDYNSITRV